MRKAFATVALLAAFLLGHTVQLPHRWVNPSPFVWLFPEVPVEASYIPSAIKSLQFPTCTISSGTTCTYANSPTVNPANALLVFNGSLSSDSASGVYVVSSNMLGQITSGTTITASSNNATANAWYGTEIEFAGAFVKNQGCSTISVANGVASNTATLSISNANKTAVSFTGWYAGVTNYTMGGAGGNQSTSVTTPHLSLSGTTLTATVPATLIVNDTRVIGYCYLEFR